MLTNTEAELKALEQRVTALYSVGKSGEAVSLAERYAEAMKARHGLDHPEYASALNGLARVLQDTNRLVEEARWPVSTRADCSRSDRSRPAPCRAPPATASATSSRR